MVFMYCVFPCAMVFWTEVTGKAVLVADLSQFTWVDVMLLDLLDAMVAVHHHAQIAPLILVILQDAVGFSSSFLSFPAHFAFCKFQAGVITAPHGLSGRR